MIGIIDENLFRIVGISDIRTISEIHKELVEFIRLHRFVSLDLSEITEFDLTLIQLIESARTFMTDEGKNISLSSAASGEILSALERGGFLSEPTDPRTQFWLAA